MPTTTPIPSSAALNLILSEQEHLGICDFQTKSDDGRIAFGRTEEEAKANFKKLGTPKSAYDKEMNRD